MLINEKKFSDLPASAQGILKEGAKVYEDTLLTEFKTMKLALLEKILDAGVIVMKPDTEAFSKAVRDVPYQLGQRIIRQGIKGARVVLHLYLQYR